MLAPEWGRKDVAHGVSRGKLLGLSKEPPKRA
jgi:hypothetical protein